jgi:peptide chain release factor 1
MIEKLEAIKARFNDLGTALTNPEIVSDNKRFTQISKEYRKLEPIVMEYNKYRNCLDALEVWLRKISTFRRLTRKN